MRFKKMDSTRIFYFVAGYDIPSSQQREATRQNLVKQFGGNYIIIHPGRQLLAVKQSVPGLVITDRVIYFLTISGVNIHYRIGIGDKACDIPGVIYAVVIWRESIGYYQLWGYFYHGSVGVDTTTDVGYC